MRRALAVAVLGLLAAGFLVGLALVLYGSDGSASAAPSRRQDVGTGSFDLYRAHDDSLRVTCWSRGGYYTLSCLPDWLLREPQARP